MTEKEKVGFIGLGNMGGGMAKNLVQKGHDVVAYDVCQDAVCIPLKKGLGEHADKLVQVGTPAEVAAQTRVIVVTYLTILFSTIRSKNELYGKFRLKHF